MLENSEKIQTIQKNQRIYLIQKKYLNCLFIRLFNGTKIFLDVTVALSSFISYRTVYLYVLHLSIFR